MITIADYLNEGENNAQSARELCTLLGLTPREIGKAVENERRQGAPICASTGPNPGYYLAGDMESMQEYCGRLKHREREIAETRRACERTIKKLPHRRPV